MYWEIPVLGFLIFLLGGSAVFMARRTKKQETIVNAELNVDTQKLANDIARAIAVELREIFKDFPMDGGTNYVGRSPTSSHQPDTGITMDESIIPMKVTAKAKTANLDGMAKEEKKVDKDIQKSKSKLAGLMKRKKK